MLTFPQLSTGALAQYPIRRTRSERTVQNVSEDGRVSSFADINGGVVTWALRYQGLTDQEVAAIVAFYEQCEGCLQSFVFLDPTINLFAYSEDYTQPCWARNTLISVAPGIDDPFGTTRATRLTNGSEGTLAVTQTVGLSGSVGCTFSGYFRGVAGSSLTTFEMVRSDGSTTRSLGLAMTLSWNRSLLNSVFASSISDTCEFSLTMPAGSSVDVFGLQLDAQPSAGLYVSSTSETGIYPASRFDSQEIQVTSTAPGESSVSLSVISKAS